jgi:hypothetical protein
MQESASLQGSLFKYVQVFMVQTAYTAIANARAKINEAPGALDLDGS